MNPKPWLIDPAALAAMHSQMQGRERPTRAQMAQREAELAAKPLRTVSGNVGVLPIQGVIEQKMSLWSYYFGGFSTERGSLELASLVTDNRVAAIVLDIDSPGGSSYGVEEFGNDIKDAAAKKPVYAIANSMAASAAYWLATQASNLYVTPGGDVGSVGVYVLHEDYSGMLEQMGVKPTFIHAGEFKVEGNPYEPLDEEAKAELQTYVDAIYARFVKAVATGRNKPVKEVKDSFGKGRLVMAEDAVKKGMADKVMTYGQLMSKLTGTTQPRQSANIDVLRLRQEHRKRMMA